MHLPTEAGKTFFLKRMAPHMPRGLSCDGKGSVHYTLSHIHQTRWQGTQWNQAESEAPADWTLLFLLSQGTELRAEKGTWAQFVHCSFPWSPLSLSPLEGVGFVAPSRNLLSTLPAASWSPCPHCWDSPRGAEGPSLQPTPMGLPVCHSNGERGNGVVQGWKRQTGLAGWRL